MTRPLPVAIAVAKVTEYLLNPDHADWRLQMRLPDLVRISADDPKALASALLDHGRLPPARITETEWGPRSIVEAPLRTPDGRDPMVRTVWQPASKDDAIAQFVTPVPLKARRSG